MNKTATLLVAGLVVVAGAWGQKPPLLAEKEVAAIAGEISGATAKRNLEGIAAFHRQRGSVGFHDAAVLVAAKLGFYGLSDVAILEFPADGKIFYGTQRSRPAWDAEKAELWQVVPDVITCDEAKGRTPLSEAEQQKAHPGVGMACDVMVDKEIKLLGSYEAGPVVLAEDSESADVTADLVDVGEGTKESDYTGKDVKGKIVLVSAQPGAVQDLAVGKFGAVGIVSYAQNQKTAWSGENLDAIRWGHLETFSVNKTFAFMISLGRATAIKDWFAQGKNHGIRLHAVVKAGQHPGYYEVVTGTIPGADEKLKGEEIVYSCHLDHQRPGANDNASGCATILEVARTLQHLIATGKLARPARTIRFIFPPEIEGTMALLNSKDYRTEKVDWTQFINVTGVEGGPPVKNPESPESGLGLPGGAEWAKRVKAVVHMDMVGGGPETKAVFHVTRGPMSLPSFVQDVAWAFAEWVNEETYAYAATGKAEFPLVEAEGGKEPLRAEYSAYTMGSDHDVYQDSSSGIPAIYLNDWPDRFIHTNLDMPANIDATKLKRVGLIGAASGYFLARNFPDLRFAVKVVNWQARAVRDVQFRERMFNLPLGRDACEFIIHNLAFEEAIETTADTVPTRAEAGFVPPRYVERYEKFVCSAAANISPKEELNKVGDSPKFVRSPSPKGPMAVFGYDYFAAEWAKRGHTTRPGLLEYEGLWGGGEEYAYEVLNFADGKRNAQEIRDAVAAEYGPVPVELVVEYLKALEEIGVVERVEVKK
ncbi:MAG TPA: M28 family peptidase [Methylomirabilota bacterium]|nr:M28 family peptidase [Methylomirabilota bacterium]